MGYEGLFIMLISILYNKKIIIYLIYSFKINKKQKIIKFK